MNRFYCHVPVSASNIQFTNLLNNYIYNHHTYMYIQQSHTISYAALCLKVYPMNTCSESQFSNFLYLDCFIIGDFSLFDWFSSRQDSKMILFFFLETKRNVFFFFFFETNDLLTQSDILSRLNMHLRYMKGFH